MAEGELKFWLENIEKMNYEGSYFSQLTVEACKANIVFRRLWGWLWWINSKGGGEIDVR